MTSFVMKPTEHSFKVAGDKEFLFEQLRLMHEHLTSIFNHVEDGRVLSVEDVNNLQFIDDWLQEAVHEFDKWYPNAMIAIIDHIEACQVTEPADAN